MDDSWTPRAVRELVDDRQRLAAADDDTLRAALAALRPGQKSNTDRRLRQAIKAELNARQTPGKAKATIAELRARTSFNRDILSDSEPQPVRRPYKTRAAQPPDVAETEPSLDGDSDTGSEQPLDAALDDHSTREQIDALGQLGVQHTQLGDRKVWYGWLAVFAALHFIDLHLGEPGYYEKGGYIDHAIALGLSRSTAYNVRHLHQYRADFLEWGERVAQERRDKKAARLYPTLTEMIKRHPAPARNSRRAQPEKLTAVEKLQMAEDEADKLATENAKLQRAVRQHADEIAWLKAEHEAGDGGDLSAELAEAKAEITRLRAELAKRPPREAPADLTPDEQLAFDLDEALSPYQARQFPDPVDDPARTEAPPAETPSGEIPLIDKVRARRAARKAGETVVGFGGSSDAPRNPAPRPEPFEYIANEPDDKLQKGKPTKQQIKRDRNRAEALRIAGGDPRRHGEWGNVATRVKTDCVRYGWVRIVNHPGPGNLPVLTDRGRERLERYEDDDPPG